MPAFPGWIELLETADPVRVLFALDLASWEPAQAPEKALGPAPAVG